MSTTGLLLFIITNYHNTSNAVFSEYIW